MASIIQFLADGGIQVSLLRGRGRRRTRRNRSHYALVAAQVEQLESRVLLTVTYNGGDIITNVNAQAVYLGSQWANSAMQSQEAQLDSFLATIVNSSYMNMLTNAGYGVGLGTASKGAVDNLSLGSTIHRRPDSSRHPGDDQSGYGPERPSPNQLYVVYVQPGVNIQLGSASSSTSFLGYHSAFAGTNASGQAVDIHYAVISYPGNAHPARTSRRHRRASHRTSTR